MNSGRESKYLTPCRSFGLKRISKKTPSTPGSSGSGAGKSVNSPFTSPLIVTAARTVPCVEKKRLSLQDSLWSTPLINKTSLKMGLSKPSGKLKTTRLLHPKDLLNNGATSGSSRNDCLDDGGVQRLGMVVEDRSKSMFSSSEESHETVSPKCSDVCTTPKSNLVNSTKRVNTIASSHKTSLGKIPDVGTTPKSVPGVCSGSDSSPNMSITCWGTDNSTKISLENCSVNNIKNGFLGWDSDSGEAVSLNSVLERFKRFLENRIINSNEACSHSSLNSVCHMDCTSNADASSESGTTIPYMTSLDVNHTVESNAQDVAGSPDCTSHSESASFPESKLHVDISKKCQLARKEKSCATKSLNDEDERRSYPNSVLFDSETEDETDNIWDFEPTLRPAPEIYKVKQNKTGKLSLKKQPASRISKRHATNKKSVMKTVNHEESSDCEIVTGQESGSPDTKSDTEKQLEKDIRKWLEGGQRVIHEIIEEVRLQKDREMTVMEVLLEQGVDPNLVGYDPQREEFLAFDKFMLQNHIS
uniref:Uncharacterized protein n=1 Tax=Lygus hesperus TaxID=30085 RepID=A0A0A9Z1Q7_LYGHE